MTSPKISGDDPGPKDRFGVVAQARVMHRANRSFTKLKGVSLALERVENQEDRQSVVPSRSVMRSRNPSDRTRVIEEQMAEGQRQRSGK